MLNAIELHTGLLARLSDLSDRFFGFTKFQIDTLMLIRQLLGQSVLQTGHERMISGQESLATIIEVLVNVLIAASVSIETTIRAKVSSLIVTIKSIERLS